MDIKYAYFIFIYSYSTVDYDIICLFLVYVADVKKNFVLV